MLSLGKSIIASFIAIAILLSISVYQYVEMRKFNDRVPYLPSDRHAIGLAIDAYRRTHGAGYEETMKGRFPVVIRFGAARCVELKLRKGWIGKSPVYCYDMDYNRIETINVNTDEIVDARKSGLP